MNYYIDFDYTLFDALKFRQELYKILEKNGLDKGFLKPTPEIAKSQGGKLLNVKKLFQSISEQQGIQKEKMLEPLEKVLSKSYEFLYEDTIEFLEFLRKQNCNIYLLSWGDKEFQEEKVIKTGIDKYFDKLIFTEELKFTLDNIDYQDSIFIDDSIKDLKGFYERKAKKVIRIRRKNGKYSNEELEIKEIEEFTTLRELKETLEK